MFQKWYNRVKREDIDMKLEKKKPLMQLFLTDRLWSALGILILIFGVILVFAFLAGLVFVLTHTPKWVFKYILFALLGVAIFFCIITTAINIKRVFVGLWLSSKLPLSKDELEGLNIYTLKEYWMFLDKYIGNNKLYISSEHLAFMSEMHYCGPLFLVTESSICLESKHYWHKLNKNRFALYDLEENLEEYDRYGVETRSWQKTGVVFAINNAAINRDIEKDKILTVWSKPMYSYVDFGFRVTPRCDSICGFTLNSHIINYKESIGRRI